MEHHNWSELKNCISHDDDEVTQCGNCTPANRLTEIYSLVYSAHHSSLRLDIHVMVN